MASYTETYVKVRVPATSANIGPGFDCLGVALDFFDELEVWCSTEDSSTSTAIEVIGQAAPENENNLIYRVLCEELEHLVAQHFISSGVHIKKIKCHNFIPHARGLGSSSVALVGAILAAKVTVLALKTGSFKFSTAQLNSIVENTAKRGVQIEGHADNVEPCCYGGLTFTAEGAWWMIGESPESARLHVRDDLRLAVLIPDTKLATTSARQVIPKILPSDEREKNKENLVNLLKLLSASGGKRSENEMDALIEATDDYIHQDRRSSLYKTSVDLMNELRKSGIPAVISGAGPTVLALWTLKYDEMAHRILDDVNTVVDSRNTWEIKYIRPSNCGVQIVSSSIQSQG
ncbi:MAG: homoserine kinase [Candidatus Ancillula sp.]|jgi:homoserine kinase|nr:homoserine kinase [Candidatus Ancillula sp.]